MKDTNTIIPMKNLKENPNLISTNIYLTDAQVTTIRIIALRYAAWITTINKEIARQIKIQNLSQKNTNQFGQQTLDKWIITQN